MKSLLSLLIVAMLSGCTGPWGNGWGVIPQNSQVCPQGTDAVSGACR